MHEKMVMICVWHGIMLMAVFLFFKSRSVRLHFLAVAPPLPFYCRRLFVFILDIVPWSSASAHHFVQSLFRAKSRRLLLTTRDKSKVNVSIVRAKSARARGIRVSVGGRLKARRFGL